MCTMLSTWQSPVSSGRICLLHAIAYESRYSRCVPFMFRMHDLLQTKKNMGLVYSGLLILFTQKGGALILNSCTMQIIDAQTLVAIMPNNTHDQECTLQYPCYQIGDPCCPIGTRPNSERVHKKSRTYVVIASGIACIYIVMNPEQPSWVPL